MALVEHPHISMFGSTECACTEEEARAQSQLGQEQCLDKMQALFGSGGQNPLPA